MEILRLLAGIRNPFLNVLMLCFSYLSEQFFILVIVDWIYLNTDKRKARGIGIAFSFPHCSVRASALSPGFPVHGMSILRSGL